MTFTRATLTVVTLALLAVPVVADAQPVTRVYRIGVLHSAFAPNVPWVEGLTAGLQELGLAEGRDFTFEHRYTEGNMGLLPRAAAELVAVKVDLIFTSNDDVTRVAMAATRTIPIVFAVARDPVGTGIVSALSHPGGNVTGVSNLTVELAPKRLEVLKELVPNLRRVWVIYDASDPGIDPVLKSARDASARLRLELLAQPVHTTDEFVRAQSAIRSGDSILVHDQPTLLNIAALLLEQSIAARIPAIFTSEFWVSQGALVSYGVDFRAAGHQAARLVAKILRGARPQDLPVEGANRVGLAINMKTAKALRLTVPPSLLARADKIIQ